MDRQSEIAVERPGSGSRNEVAGERVPVETRDRSGYFAELRAAVEGTWDQAVGSFRERWAEHQERWPASGRESVDRSADEPGSWRGDSGRYLDAADNEAVEARCERVAEAERTTISPAMREIEAADPNRELVGWDYRLKGTDRIKDKVADLQASRPGLSCGEAMSAMPDAIRYTFVYRDEGYAAAVSADFERLREAGFELAKPLRNTWTSDQYRGINSQWQDRNGQRFEVQFHTNVSVEAKELTHALYEKARNPLTTDAERDELMGYQRELYKHVPPPEGAAGF